MKIIGVFIAFCAAAVLGIASLVIGACGENGVFGGKISFDELTAGNASEGLIVEGELYYVWDMFADEIKQQSGGETITVGEYYTVVVPYSFYEENPVFIGFYSQKSSELSSLETLRSAFEDVLLGNDSEADIMHFRGKLKKLEGVQLEYMTVSVSNFIDIFELGDTADASGIMLPYVIESYDGSDYMLFLIAGIALTIIGFGGVLVLILKDIGEDNE